MSSGSTNRTETLRVLVGAALVDPPLAVFVNLDLDAGEFASGESLTTVALAVAVNHLRGTEGGLEGTLVRLALWGELERVGDRARVAELMADRPALAAKIVELRTRLPLISSLPRIMDEPIVKFALEVLGVEDAVDEGEPEADPTAASASDETLPVMETQPVIDVPPSSGARGTPS